MKVNELPLQPAKVIRPKVFRDERGFFLESFSDSRYAAHGVPALFAQDNHSYSTKHSLRGMHFQSSPGQGKLVRCAIGRIYDVIVDMRPSSPTFKKWTAVVLDDQEHQQLYVPVGFAHGFCVLSDEAHVMYKVTTPYNSATEKGFRWNDPEIGIEWPTQTPILSKRDQESPSFAQTAHE